MSFQDNNKDPFFVSGKAILFSLVLAAIVISIAFYGIFINFSEVLLPIVIILFMVQIGGYYYISYVEKNKRNKPSKFWWSNDYK